MHEIFHHKTVSKLLLATIEALKKHPTPQIKLDELVSIVGRRAFSFIIILFAILNILPLAIVPGFAVITAIPILFVSWQMIIGRNYLWLPQFVAEKTLSTSHLTKTLTKSLKFFSKLEVLLKPRFQFFFTAIGTFCIGVILFLLSIVLMLPIPFSNNILGFLFLLYALSLLEYDGVMLLIAVALTATYFSLVYHITTSLVRFFLQ